MPGGSIAGTSRYYPYMTQYMPRGPLVAGLESTTKAPTWLDPRTDIFISNQGSGLKAAYTKISLFQNEAAFLDQIQQYRSYLILIGADQNALDVLAGKKQLSDIPEAERAKVGAVVREAKDHAKANFASLVKNYETGEISEELLNYAIRTSLVIGDDEIGKRRGVLAIMDNLAKTAAENRITGYKYDQDVLKESIKLASSGQA